MTTVFFFFFLPCFYFYFFFGEKIVKQKASKNISAGCLLPANEDVFPAVSRSSQKYGLRWPASRLRVGLLCDYACT